MTMTLQEKYPLGCWVRFYTNGLRGLGATKHIGQVVDYGTVMDHWTQKPIGVSLVTRTAVAGYEVPIYNIVSKIDIIKYAKRLGLKKIFDYKRGWISA